MTGRPTSASTGSPLAGRSFIPGTSRFVRFISLFCGPRTYGTHNLLGAFKQNQSAARHWNATRTSARETMAEDWRARRCRTYTAARGVTGQSCHLQSSKPRPGATLGLRMPPRASRRTHEGDVVKQLQKRMPALRPPNSDAGLASPGQGAPEGVTARTAAMPRHAARNATDPRKIAATTGRHPTRRLVVMPQGCS
jgi:hypothetical protein